MATRPNIIWLVPDSIRQDPHPDPLGRLEFMDEIKKTSVEFRSVYTTAPSTLMSLTSVFTSVPSVFFAKDYTFIKNHRVAVPTIYSDLEKLGYHLYFFTFYQPLREVFSVFWNTGSHYKNKKKFENYYKTCTDASKTKAEVTYFLNNHKLKKPFCFFYHLFREDLVVNESYDLSIDLKDIFQRCVASSDADETITLIHSDHGYPIYRGESDKEFMWTHDLVLSEENIRVPFFLGAPGLANHSENHHEFSLLDIYPTLCELAGGSASSPFLQGKSMLREPDTDRLLRVDNRFEFQKERKTALVRNRKKTIYNYQTKTAEHFHLVKGESIPYQGTKSDPFGLISAMWRDNEKGKKLHAAMREFTIEARVQELKKHIAGFQNVIVLGRPTEDQMILISTACPDKVTLSPLFYHGKFKATTTGLIFLVHSLVYNEEQEEQPPDVPFIALDQGLGLEMVSNPDSFMSKRIANSKHRKTRAERGREERAKTKEEYFSILARKHSKD